MKIIRKVQKTKEKCKRRSVRYRSRSDSSEQSSLRVRRGHPGSHGRMEKAHKRSRDPSDCSGISDRFSLASGSKEGSKTSFNVKSKTQSLHKRGRNDGKEGRHHSSRSLSRGIHFLDICGSQRFRGVSPCFQYEEAQPCNSRRAFQDGINSERETFDPKRGLHDLCRSEGCVFCNSNSCSASQVSSLRVGGEVTRISGLPLWDEVGSQSVHKTLETGGVASQKDVHPDSDLLGRSAALSRQQEALPPTERYHNKASDQTWVYHKLGKVNADSYSEDPFLRSFGQFQGSDVESSSRQARDSTGRVSQFDGAQSGVSKEVSQPFRQDDCVSRGYSRGTGVLPLPSNGSHISSESGSPVSQCDRDQPDQHRRAELVAQLSSPVEWQSYAYVPPRSGDHIRCIPDGMGGPLQHGGDWGSLDSGRATVPYKLSGTVGGISGSQVICKEFERSPHSDETGQHYSPVIHPPSGGHTHRHVVQFSSHDVALGLGKRSSPVGLSCSRSGECGGGLSVQGLQRQDRVDAVTTSFQGDVPVPEVLSNCRPVCLPSEPSAGQICCMEARSRSGGDRRLLPELAARERLCISALLDLGRDSPEDQERGGNSVGGSSNLDSPAMVSPTSAVSCSTAGLSSSDNRVSGAASLRSATPIVGESPSSGLDCLRRRYVAEGFSEEVSEVLSQSCRPSTHGQYESAWRAWCGWCNQRSLDPVSAPVVSVAEFLVEKEKDGLAFRTLGVYSAAISLYHLPVEGKAVGECAQLSKLKKGFFNRNPPKPRYLVTWDVEPVLRCLRGLPTWEALDLKSLTLKLVLLLALVLVGRVSSLVYIDTECLSVTQSSLRFIPSKLLKQSRPGRIPQCVHIESFSDKRLCPVYGVKHYLAVTRPFRRGESQLFLSYIRPHKKVGTSTISRWILKMLEIAGVDVSLFRAHSTRGAAASASAKLGVSMSDIMKAAGWASDSTFARHYHRPSASSVLARSLLESV